LNGLDLKQCVYCGNYFPLAKYSINNSRLKCGKVNRIPGNQCVYCRQLQYRETKALAILILQGKRKKPFVNDCKMLVPKGVTFGHKTSSYYATDDDRKQQYNKLITLQFDDLSNEEKSILENE